MTDELDIQTWLYIWHFYIMETQVFIESGFRKIFMITFILTSKEGIVWSKFYLALRNASRSFTSIMLRLIHAT